MKLGKYAINEIYNEDCYKAVKDIPDKSVDLVIIDPPYSFGGGGKMTGIFKNRRNRHFDDIEEKKLDANYDYQTILDEIIRTMKRIYIYIWCNKHQIHQYLDYFEEKDCIFEIIVWCKPNPMPLSCNNYLPDKEYCLLFREVGTYLKGTYDTKNTFYVQGTNVADKKIYDHPTIKPLDIIKNFIINSSEKDDIVLDAFLGSGTTCVAAKELGRNYIGFEIDKNYFNIAKDRLNGINQRDKEKTDNGQLSLDLFS